MKFSILIFTLVLILSTGCSNEKNDCSFENLDTAYECTCQLLSKKDKSKTQKSLDQLKEITKDLDKSFEEAIENGNFKLSELKAKLKKDCEHYED